MLKTAMFWFMWKFVKCPVLIVRGGKSMVLPEDIAVKMRKKYKGPSIEEIVFEDCGHVPSLMEAEQIERLIGRLILKHEG